MVWLQCHRQPHAKQAFPLCYRYSHLIGVAWHTNENLRWFSKVSNIMKQLLGETKMWVYFEMRRLKVEHCLRLHLSSWSLHFNRFLVAYDTSNTANFYKGTTFTSCNACFHFQLLLGTIDCFGWITWLFVVCLYINSILYFMHIAELKLTKRMYAQ